MTTTKTTEPTPTVTDSQIRDYLDEFANDYEGVVCLIALEGPCPSFEGRFGGGGYLLTKGEREAVEAMSQAQARAFVAQWVADLPTYDD